jgi:hypothetical protein
MDHSPLLYEGRRTFLDLLQSLGRNYVFSDDQPLPPAELKTWLFFAESEFLPRDDQIKVASQVQGAFGRRLGR